MTADPSVLVAVKPKRARCGSSSAPAARARAWSTSEGAAQRVPSRTYRNSLRVLRRPIAVTVRASGRQALAPLGSAPRKHLPSALRRHTRAKAVAPLADEPRWLIGPFHGRGSLVRLPGAYRVTRRAKSILGDDAASQ